MSPINTLAQLWLWRLELRVAAVLFVIMLFLGTAALGAVGIDPVWAFYGGFGAIGAVFLWHTGRAFMDCLDGGAGALERLEQGPKGGLIDYSPGWQQRLLDRDIARWKAEGNVKQLRAFKVPGYTD